MKSTQLVGKKARIISDNENYDRFREEVLLITHADNKGTGYDNSCYPEMLCSFDIVGKPGEEFPFSLYEYEFELI